MEYALVNIILGDSAAEAAAAKTAAVTRERQKIEKHNKSPRSNTARPRQSKEGGSFRLRVLSPANAASRGNTSGYVNPSVADPNLLANNVMRPQASEKHHSPLSGPCWDKVCSTEVTTALGHLGSPPVKHRKCRWQTKKKELELGDLDEERAQTNVLPGKPGKGNHQGAMLHTARYSHHPDQRCSTVIYFLPFTLPYPAQSFSVPFLSCSAADMAYMKFCTLPHT
jgi:hypothetical protein